MVENKKDVEQLKKSLKKCLCPTEKPLNAEHARVVLMKTYDIKGGHRIWSIAQTYHLDIDCFAMWKFCILLHKILHEGHQQVLKDSQTYKEQLQKYAQCWWSQSTDPMGQCIAWYCQVLLRKLSFHQTYTHIKGNFQYEYEPSMDMNIFFQLCIDVCDYLEDLLQLQRVIFTNLQRHNISADSKKGICRLAALVTIIAECDKLYRLSVSVLQLLRTQLAPEDISGLNTRLCHGIFKELNSFFEYVRRLRLPFYNFEIPQLPVCAPSFIYAPSGVIGQHAIEPSAPALED